jgi:hypothetical protein
VIIHEVPLGSGLPAILNVGLSPGAFGCSNAITGCLRALFGHMSKGLRFFAKMVCGDYKITCHSVKGAQTKKTADFQDAGSVRFAGNNPGILRPLTLGRQHQND